MLEKNAEIVGFIDTVAWKNLLEKFICKNKVVFNSG